MVTGAQRSWSRFFPEWILQQQQHPSAQDSRSGRRSRRRPKRWTRWWWWWGGEEEKEVRHSRSCATGTGQKENMNIESTTNNFILYTCDICTTYYLCLCKMWRVWRHRSNQTGCGLVLDTRTWDVCKQPTTIMITRTTFMVRPWWCGFWCWR